MNIFCNLTKLNICNECIPPSIHHVFYSKIRGVKNEGAHLLPTFNFVNCKTEMGFSFDLRLTQIVAYRYHEVCSGNGKKLKFFNII